MSNYRKLIKLCNLVGFRSLYALAVLLLLVTYAVVEGVFASYISSVNFQINTKSEAVYNDAVNIIPLFLLKISLHSISTFFLVKFGYFSGFQYQKHTMRILNNHRYLLSTSNGSIKSKRYLLTEPLNIANLISIPLLLFLSEVCVSATLGVIVIFSVSWDILLIMVCIIFSLIIFGLISRQLTSAWGIHRKKYEGLRLQAINAMIDNYPFFSLNRFQKQIESKILKNSAMQFQFNAYQGFLDKFPRIYLELVIFLIVLSLFAYSKNGLNSTEDLIGEFLLLGYVGYRLVPASNRILMSLQSINFALEGVETDISDLIDPDALVVTSDGKLEITSDKVIIPAGLVTKGTDVLLTWDHMTISRKKSTIVNIVGQNGSGKSLFIQAISGSLNIDLQPDEIFYFPQRLNNLSYSLSDILDNDKLNTNKYDRIHNFDQPMSTLSGGEQQKVIKAYTDLSGAKLIFMDEPTSALDVSSKGKFWDWLQHKEEEHSNQWIFIVSHDDISTELTSHRLIVKNKYVSHWKE